MRITILALLTVIGTVGCATSKVDPFDDKIWKLVSMGKYTKVGALVTISKTSEGFRGEGPCNRYIANIDDRLSDWRVGPVSATKRACMDNQMMALERDYFKMLTDAVDAKIVASGNQMHLLNAAGDVIAVFALHDALREPQN